MRELDASVPRYLSGAPPGPGAPASEPLWGPLLVRDLLRHVPAGVLVQDARSGRFLLQTERLTAMLGRELQEDVPLPLFRLDGTPLEEDALPLRRALASGEVVEGLELEFRHPERGARTLRVTTAPIRGDDGTVLAAMAICLDVTEEVRAQGFEKLLVGIVGHDIRNPLSAISIALSVLLKRSGLEPPLVQSVKRAMRSVERIQRIVGDLLDFTSIRLGGGLPVHPRRTDLGVLAREMVEDLQSLQPDRRFELSVLGEPCGQWDADRLDQVLSNLLGNALQHSPSACPIRVRVQGEAHDAVELSVHNGGAPIPRALLPVLFEPFRRGGDERGARSHSIGMGLYIAKAIVEAHGGTVHVHSTEHDGTTFTVRLPKA